MSNWPLPDESYQGILVDPFEKTPSMHEPIQETPEIVPGIYRNCYICGISVSGLNKDAIVTKMYTRPGDKWGRRPSKYVMTFCYWCNQAHFR